MSASSMMRSVAVQPEQLVQSFLNLDDLTAISVNIVMAVLKGQCKTKVILINNNNVKSWITIHVH